MNRILEIDTENHVAVVQPGVTLDQLNADLAPHGLVYPVFPGENSASLGGNVATNAGGMRAVKYGVTRHQVLGLEAVLATGEVHPHRRQVREGHDRLRPHPAHHRLRGHARPRHRGDPASSTRGSHHRRTVLAPFATLDEVTAAVPRIVGSGVGPADPRVHRHAHDGRRSPRTSGLDLGIPEEIKDTALAYLVVVLENTPRRPARGGRRGARRAARRARRPRRLRAAARRRPPR